MKRSKKSNAIMHLASVMWEYSKGQRKLVLLYASMAVGAVLVSLCTPLLMARVMRAVQRGGDGVVSESLMYLIGFVLMGVLFWLLHGPSRVIETSVAFWVKSAFQLALFRKVTELPTRWHRDNHSGEIIDQVAKGSQAIGDFTECGFEVIHLATRFVGAVAILTWFMPWAGVAVIGAGIGAVLVIVFFDRRLVKRYSLLNKRFNEVAASVQDYLTNVATVISLRLEERVGRELQAKTHKIFPEWRATSVLCETKWFMTSRFVDITQAGVLFLFIATSADIGKPIDFGMAYALTEYLRSIGESFYQFTGRYGDLVVKSTRVRATEHIDQAHEEYQGVSSTTALPKGWERLEIQNLTFSHEDGERGAGISGVSFTLERGRSYAVVGESGSGKSTTLKAIRGLHRPQSGSVQCDGVISSFAAVSHSTTLIPQDPEIFADTVLFNITMGIDAPEIKILRAMDIARFTPVLKRLPRGLKTSIAEKGVKLSTGERQRLALARGIFFVDESESDIILVDEPTSSVDMANEKLIYRALIEEFKDKCLVSIIHKLHLLSLFDEVLVFDQGRLVEHGSYHELMTRGGRLAEMYGASTLKVSA